MKYNVGDRVRTKSLDWYNKNKDEFGNIDLNEDFTFYADRSRYCGKVFTISKVFDNSYEVKEDNNEYYWIDEMFEGLVEEEMSLDKAGQIMDFEYEGLAYSLPNGYIFKDENGNVINATKIVLEKKKKEYPKTYEECYQITGLSKTSDIYGYKNGLLFEFQKLLIARDAYWKIAGEEMGLGEPWKPDWLDDDTKKYVITSTKAFETFGGLGYINYILAFPTKEMRDAFKENFGPDIEICKEFL